MSYSRTTALAYLNSEFGELATDAQIALTDDGWKTVLDKALRGGTADDADQEALLDLFALERLSKALAPRVSVSKTVAGTAAQKARNQAFTQVKALLDDARTKAKEMGLLGGSTWQYGSFGLDYAEPSEDF